MKNRIFTLLLLLALSNVVLAQNDSQKEYFDQNIETLDPIEGIYDFEYVLIVHSAYAGWEQLKRHFKCTIRKTTTVTNETVYLVESFSGDSKGAIAYIEKLGDSGYYSFITYTVGAKQQMRFKLDDLFSFSVQSESSYRSVSGVYTIMAVKTYPTRSLYQSVIEKKERAATESQISNWSGSGFALREGFVCTNYHVIDGAKTIKIHGVDGDFHSSYFAKVVASDKFNDLALLKIEDQTFKGFRTIPYKVKTSMGEVGEDIFVLGYPLTATMGDEIKLTTGVISSRTGYQGDVSLYQISAPVQPGNSGGPLFDSQGNLIGIVSAKHEGTENVGYAIKTSYLKNLIESSISQEILPSNNQVAGLPLTEKVKSLRNYVFMISCSNNGSSRPTHSASPIIPTDSTLIKTIKYPTVSKTTIESAKINSVKLAKNYTAIEITINNQSGEHRSLWSNIDKNTYVSVNGTRYTLIKTNGIEIAPKKTFFSHAGQNITFTLYFPPISDTVTSIDLIEPLDSGWKFYGISLNK